MALIWSTTADATLNFKWIGGPAVNPPKRKGLGTLLIQNLTKEHGRSAALAFEASWLSCSFTVKPDAGELRPSFEGQVQSARA